MKTAPRNIADDLLEQVRRMFYPPARAKEFFQDKRILLRVVSEPAAWLKFRGVKLPAKRHREIVSLVLTTIRREGKQVSKARRLSAYLLHCMQAHLSHHGEEYYYEGRRMRDVLADVLLGARPAHPNDPAPDDATDLLAAVNSTVRSKGGRPKKHAVVRDENLRFF